VPLSGGTHFSMRMKTTISIITLFAAFFLASCYDSLVDNPIGNKPPNTSLWLKPDSTISQQISTLPVNWTGDDPDGLVVGYYFSWDGNNWTFTTKNDSTFFLQIGITDTSYLFRVAAVDNSGNGRYDSQVFQNNINFGPEPFIDLNGNGVFDQGEPYSDIGLIDPTPAELRFPIKNSAPIIKWDSLTVLPANSFPVMTFGWEVFDTDGVETVQNIRIALNDTTDPNSFVSLRGSVRLITLRVKDFTVANPETEILLDGQEFSILPQKLKGIKLNDTNRVYIQAIDQSGAVSAFASLPKPGATWFVIKPKGKLLLIDDDVSVNDNPTPFYQNKFDNIQGGALNGKYDILDVKANRIPYFGYNFLLTMKLYNYAFWYTDNNPSLDLAAANINRFLDAGGKLFMSMVLPSTFEVAILQDFLPIDSTSTMLNFLFPGALVSPVPTTLGYPEMTATSSIARMRNFHLTPGIATPVYYLSQNQLPGHTGFFDQTKRLFYIGVPLHKTDGGGANVGQLLTKVLFEDFGLTL